MATLADTSKACRDALWHKRGQGYAKAITPGHIQMTYLLLLLPATALAVMATISVCRFFDDEAAKEWL